jgi:DNA-binding NtrC family response regulator
VALNCAAIPDNLLESELFGHEKGAFTGAVARRVGKFEEADGGTLLLDEISEMEPRLQAKLLRALQEREIDRVGGTAPVKVDVRILATSNRDLPEAVAKGDFRQDLYFRLNVVNLRLPDLAERPRDIEPLCRHFIRKYCAANGMAEKPLSTAALAELRIHSWPGNVRELENAMQRAVLLSSPGEVGPEAILLSGGMPGFVPPPQAPIREAAPRSVPMPEDAPETPRATGSLVGRTVADVERDLILDTLSHTLGNRTHAANILGISIRTLRNKLKAYAEAGIAVPVPGEGEEAAAE